jgi:bacillithiol biosynthesis cysteine-adding enzyme BshC
VKCKSRFIGLRESRHFSPLVLDYVEGSRSLNAFYRHRPDMDGIREAITERRTYPVDRPLLVEAIRKSHGDRPLSDAQQANLDALLKPNTFTVCSAHQPNVFSGYLYFVYKILHSISLAEACRAAIPDKQFVPVFVLGSEDNDLAELNRVNIDGVPLVWETRQTGAVGRMTVDSHLLRLIDDMERQLGHLPHAAETVSMLRDAYKEGLDIASSTTRLIDHLFSSYGLLVLQPDQPELKRKMIPVFREEVKNQASYLVVQKTIQKLEQVHKVQVNPREVNLFYLDEGLRSRIVKRNNGFFVDGTTLDYSVSSLITELDKHPERFSPNVILRGLYQESILPNIAFVGGGSEIAYWLELRDLFDHFRVPFPVLVLRNSFLLVGEEQAKMLKQSGWDAAELFKPERELFEESVRQEAAHRLDLETETRRMQEAYRSVASAAEAVDPTLRNHVAALEKKTLDRLKELEKKMLRAEKRKHEVTGKRIQKVRNALFPNTGLQERYENVIPYIAQYGPEVIDCIHRSSKPFTEGFCILDLNVKEVVRKPRAKK